MENDDGDCVRRLLERDDPTRKSYSRVAIVGFASLPSWAFTHRESDGMLVESRPIATSGIAGRRQRRWNTIS